MDIFPIRTNLSYTLIDFPQQSIVISVISGGSGAEIGRGGSVLSLLASISILKSEFELKDDFKAFEKFENK